MTGENSNKEVLSMSWGRVVKYAAVVLVAMFMVGFFFGFAMGFIQNVPGLAAEQDIYLLIALLNAAMTLTSWVVVVSVFGVMAYRMRERVIAHVLLVALLAWLVSFPLDVLLVGQPVEVWALSGVVMAVCALVGLGLGVGLRALAAQTAEEPRPSTT